eukprot:244461_1
MLTEIFLTGLFTAGIAAVIFLLFFNTKTVKIQDKKRNKKKGKKSKKNASNKPKPLSFKNKFTHAAKVKRKIKLADHEHLVSVFRAHTGDITGVAWHQSGKYLISSAKDKYIYIWENPTEAQVTSTFIGSVKTQDNGYFSCLNTIITQPSKQNHTDPYGSYQEEDEEKKQNPLRLFDDLSNSVFASTNGCFGLNSYHLKFAATAHKIRCQLTSNLQTEFMTEDVKCICVPPDLSFIAVSGNQNTKIYFYDMKKKQRQSKNKKIKVNVAPPNRKKATLRKVAQNADKPMEVIDGGQFVNYEMNVSADGNWLSIGTFKKDIRLWRINYVKPGKRDAIQEMRFGGTSLACSLINAHQKSVTCVAFSCDSQFMISSSLDGWLKVWDIVNCDYARGHKPKVILERDLGIGAIRKLVISHEYDIIAVLDEKQTIFIYKIKYEKAKIKMHCTFKNVLFNQKDQDAKINCIQFSPDSQYIAVGTSDFDVRVYKIPAHKKSSK